MKKFFLFFTINLVLVIFVINFNFALAKDCGDCHKIEKAQFEKSVHADEISCTDCHQDADSNHSKGFKSAVDCLSCHDKMDKIKTTVHAKALFDKDKKVFKCYACHGTHDILPKSNKFSKVNPANLNETCTSCHKDIKGKGLLGFFGKFKISAHEKIYAGTKYSADNCLNCHHGSVVHGEKMLNPSNCNNCHNKNSAKFHTQVDKAVGLWDFIAFLFLVAVLLCITFRFYKIKNKKMKDDE